MKTRVAMLTHDEANAEKRPFRVVGTVSGPTNGYVSVEYLDVYEYKFVYSNDLLQHTNDGWHVIETDMNHTGACFILRRAKSATDESAADDDAIRAAFEPLCAAIDKLDDHWLLWPHTARSEAQLVTIAHKFPGVVFRVRSMNEVPDYELDESAADG